MRQKANIQLAGNWDPSGYDVAMSSSGNYIAVKYVRQDGFDEEGPPNIFVYDTTGKVAFSFVNSHGGEHGVAFWPNDHYVITTGCGHMNNWSADGIKQWLIGNRKEFKHLFSDTPLTGISTHIYGVTPNGRYILGTNSYTGGWIIDTHTNKVIPAKYIDVNSDWAVFSQDGRFTGIARNLYTAISSKGIVIDNNSGQILWEDQNESVLAFHPDNKCFVNIGRLGSIVFRDLPRVSKLTEFSLEKFAQKVHTITAAAYSQDGKKLAIGPVDDRYVLIFDKNSMELLEKLCLADKGLCRLRLMKFTNKDELVIVELHSMSVDWQTNITIWE